jgi:hypothetical protein
MRRVTGLSGRCIGVVETALFTPKAAEILGFHRSRRALLQLLKQPSEWEKTTHGVARARRTPDASAWLA